jgi:DNA-binding transcriptional MocR family regulator
MIKKQDGWIPKLKKGNTPVYQQIAGAIADDITTGRLMPEQRLPAQRKLAGALGIDFTTVARAYVEAQRRGLVDSTVGRGTFVCGKRRPAIPRAVEGRPNVDLSMNMPPEPDAPEMMQLMQAGYAEVGADLRNLLRYQDFCGSADDRAAGTLWLRRRGLVVPVERTLVTAGAQCALLAVLATLAPPGSVICCEELTYPGLRALAGQLGLKLVGLPMDSEGIDAVAFAAACAQYAPKALYCNPTLLNPTTATMSAERRQVLVEVARFHNVAIIEDDAYGFLPRSGPPPLASIGPDITFYIAGLSKCLGAGLRVAFLVSPDAYYTARLTAAVRATTMMVSPITAALATRWIRDGTADLILSTIRKECAVRQKIAARALQNGSFDAVPDGFHLWLRLPAPWGRKEFAATMAAAGVAVVASDAFFVSMERSAPEAVRVCVGGVADRYQIQHAMELIGQALSHPPLCVAHGI